MKEKVTYIAVAIASSLLAFFVCANYNINPFGGVHGEGSTDTVYIPKTITVEIPSVTAPVLHGKPLTESQKISLHSSRFNSRSGELNTYDVKKTDTVYRENTPCPSFAIDTSLRWATSQQITLPDTSFVAKDSGSYSFKFIVYCLFGRVVDFSFDGTPLHPVVIEKQITNTITIQKMLRLGLFTEYDLIDKKFVVGLRGTVNLGALSFYGAPYYDGNNLHAPLGAEGLIFEH